MGSCERLNVFGLLMQNRPFRFLFQVSVLDVSWTFDAEVMVKSRAEEN